MLLKRLALMSLWLLATACQGIEVGFEAEVTPRPVETTATHTPETTPQPTATMTAQPTLHPLAGLIYTIGAGNGLWRIGPDGAAELLTDQHYPTLSPDQSQVLYAIAYEGDIWLKELPDGLGTNLTQTPDRDENRFWWWPANPGVIVFSSRTEATGPFVSTVGMMNADGSNYRLLEETTPILSRPALSPDGQSFAFDKDAEPWLYRLNGGAERLTMPNLGLAFEKYTFPAWSQDGTRLAWLAIGSDQAGVVVMDLAQGDARLLHPYTIIGGSEIYTELAWSPDGQWLAVLTQGERPGERVSLWVLRTDGSQEHYLGGLASSPVWSPDSQSLVYTQLPSGASSFDAASVMQVQVGQWQPQPLDLPGGAQVMQWTTPMP